MNPLKIEKKVRKASFYLTNGNKIEGEVFLSLSEQGGSGPQNLGDLLNEKEQFIPVKTEKSIFLLHLKHVVQAKISLKDELEETMRQGSGFTITLKMETGGTIVGDVYIALKNGAFGRVKDYVNQNICFFRVIQQEHIVYVNQKYIYSIHE